MASEMFLHGIDALLDGEIDLAADDIRVMLVMNTTTADTQCINVTLAEFEADLTTIGEPTGGSYARYQLTGEATTIDEPNDYVEFSGSNATFDLTSVTAGSNYQGLIVYKHVGSAATNVLIAWIEFAAEITNTATQVDITWNSEGIFYARTAP